MWTIAAVKILMAYAVVMAGWGPAIDHTTIKFMSAEQIDELACEHTECEIYGFVSADEPNVIVIRKDLDLSDPFVQSIVVHEMVHVLQYDYLDKSLFKSCVGDYLMEQQAYKISNKYLKMYDIRPMPVISRCED